jgi:FkbM family methyltransferase
VLIDYQTCLTLIGKTVKKVLHIGAHIGEEAGAYSSGGVTDVIWFEANDTLIPDLRSHTAQFKMNCQVCNIALWDKDEVLIFNVTNNFQSSSFYDLADHSKYYPTIKVTERKELMACRLESLDILDFYDFDFINIDTQGAELAILKGMGALLLSPTIKGIYLEVNREPLYKGIPLVDEIDKYLANYGFLRILSKWTNKGWGDALYVRIGRSVDRDAHISIE